MIKLRLRRMGAKRQPSYRIVAAEARSPRDGRFIEILGYSNPKTDPLTLKVNNERAKYWISKGARPSDSVRTLLARHLTRDRGVVAEPVTAAPVAPTA